jgi:DNA-binding MarR family transcriptional regulator
MLSDTERRILSRLSEFSQDFEKSWDVPRSLSLPGLAESLGLVRSSLHKPISRLVEQGFVFSRTAHVTGGGSRKRTVVHITADGRSKAESFELESLSKTGKGYGSIPNFTKLFGRDEKIQDLLGLVTNGENIFLSGLPGIGKTSLARGVVNEVLNKGWNVRWATCYSNTDVHDISKQWLGGNPPRDRLAFISQINKNKNLLVIDEIQEVHTRHINNLKDLLYELRDIKASILVIIRSPNPFSLIEGYSDFRLSGISEKDGRSLLPEDINEEMANQIVKALGGHPLALHLWNPESNLPEEVEAVQQFIESTVIEKLSDHGISTLDELSISPNPLNIDELFNPEGIFELDESAILRWHNKKFEPHHLIKNVRRLFWSENQMKGLHNTAADNWSLKDGYRAQWMESYHRVKSQNFEKEWLIDKISKISEENTASAAIIIDEALCFSEDSDYRIQAVDLAFERAEYDIAEAHLSNIEISPKKQLLMARLSRIKGDIESASELESQAIKQLSPLDKIRFQVSTLVRKYDDRLPGRLRKSLANEILSEINDIILIDISDRDRNTAELSLNLLKHAIALQISDLSLASQSRSELEIMMSGDNETLVALDLRTRLTISSTPELLDSSLESIRLFVDDCSDPLKKISLIHAVLDKTRGNHPIWVKQLHEDLFNNPLREDMAAYRRINAQCWYWRGILNSNLRLSCWQESIHRFRSAECTLAANELLDELTRSI